MSSVREPSEEVQGGPRELQELLERGQEGGCLELSEVEQAVEALGLDEEEAVALHEELQTRGVRVDDDCGRDGPDPSYATRIWRPPPRIPCACS